MTDLLYRWPPATRFGRVVPKNKFYEHGTITPAVRRSFVDQVQRITWANKLSPETLNLPGDDQVGEIQVFQIDAKDDDVNDAVLRAIDRSIPSPIIFEVHRGQAGGPDEHVLVRMTAIHKRQDRRTPTSSVYSSTDWLPANTERRPLPTATSLRTLYIDLLAPLSGVPTEPGEGLDDVIDRVEDVHRLERDIERLLGRIRKEPQFNRKVELRRELKNKQAELAELM